MSKWTTENFIHAIQTSKSIKQVIKKLGVSAHFYDVIRKEIIDNNIDISHFTKEKWNIPEERIVYLTQNSTSYTEILNKLGISLYSGSYENIKNIIKKLNIDTTHFTHLSPRNTYGSGYIDDHGYRRIGGKGEHRIIMEKFLGRILLPNETVHHKNGDRQDNRIENLELWNTYQPKGQKIEDKVEWAINVLSTYSPNVLRKQFINKITFVDNKSTLKHSSRKLTMEQVRNIRKDRLNGMTKQALSKKYAVSLTSIHCIIHNKTYKE